MLTVRDSNVTDEEIEQARLEYEENYKPDLEFYFPHLNQKGNFRKYIHYYPKNFKNTKNDTLLHLPFLYECEEKSGTLNKEDESDKIQIIEEMISRGESLFAVNDSNQTPLDIAAQIGNSVKIFEFLINKAKEEETTKRTTINYARLISLAAQTGNFELIKYLMKNHSDRFTQLDIDNALINAVKKYTEIKDLIQKKKIEFACQSLQANNSSVNVLTEQRKAAIKLALDNYAAPIVRSLISDYSDNNLKNNLMDYALNIAMKNQDLHAIFFIFRSKLDKILNIDVKRMEKNSFLCGLLISAEKRLGTEKLVDIITLISENKNINSSQFNRLLSVAIELNFPKKLNTSEAKYENNKEESWNQFKQLLADFPEKITWDDMEIKSSQLIKERRNLISARKLEHVLNDFKKSPEVSFPLSDSELLRYEKEYKKILQYDDSFVSLSDIEIRSQLEKFGGYIEKKQGDPDECKLILIALIREQLIRLTGLIPNSVQMICLLALLNGEKIRFGQQITGEGKSLVELMLCIYKVLTKDKGKVIYSSSSNDLVDREKNNSEAVLNSFGISSAFIKDGSDLLKKLLGTAPDIKNTNVLYGQPSDFLHYLAQSLNPYSFERSDNLILPQIDWTEVTAIIDELDSSFLDETSPFVNSDVLYPNLSGLINTIWEFLSKNSAIKEVTEPLIQGLRAHLQEKLNIDPPVKLLKEWLASGMVARDLLENGVDYAVVGDDILIAHFDYNGQVSDETVRWENLIHNFLEAKEKLKIKTDSFSYSETDFFYLLEDVSEIYGLSATLGQREEREMQFELLNKEQEVKEVNGLSNQQLQDAKNTVPSDQKEHKEAKEDKYHFDCPTYLPKQINTSTHVVVGCDGKDIDTAKQNYKNKLLQEIKEKVDSGRPVLIVCKTIKETKELDKFLTESTEFKELLSNNKSSIQTYNDLQPKKDIASILKKAGEPGAITIGTYKATRGTDIVLTQEALKNGGLHVMATSYAKSKRFEEQVFGRCLRQGQPGSYQYFIFDETYNDKMDKKEYFSAKFLAREKEVAKKLNHRKKIHKLKQMQFQLQKLLCYLPLLIRKSIQESWVVLLKKMRSILDSAITQINENDSVDVTQKLINSAHQQIWVEFLKFWNETNVADLIGMNPVEFAKKCNKKLGDYFENYAPISQPLVNDQASKILVTDFDLTLTRVNTYGLALSLKPNTLLSNFKNPNELKNNLNAIKSYMPIGLASFGSQILLQRNDGSYFNTDNLFRSGKESVTTHLQSLLGDNWKRTIHSVQVYETLDNGSLRDKVIYQISENQFQALEREINQARTALDDLAEVTDRDVTPEIQRIYDHINKLFSQFKNKREVLKEQTADDKFWRCGKEPHIAAIKKDLAMAVSPSNTTLMDDSVRNNYVASLSGTTTLDNVCHIDNGKCFTRFLSATRKSKANLTKAYARVKDHGYFNRYLRPSLKPKSTTRIKHTL